MGYRSEVAYRIAFANKEILNEFIALVMLKGGEEKQALSECEIEVLDNGRRECFVNFYADDVKWYDSYTDVQAHTWLYKYAVERFPEECAYKFIRIGEEMGDIEEEEEGSDDLMDYVQDDFHTYTCMELPFSSNYEPIGDNLQTLDNDVKV